MGRGSPSGDLLLLPRPHPLPRTRTLPPPPPLIAPLHEGREGRRRGREGGRGRGSGTLVRPTPRPGGLIRTTTGVLVVGVRIGGPGRGRTSGGRVRVRGGVGEVRL